MIAWKVSEVATPPPPLPRKQVTTDLLHRGAFLCCAIETLVEKPRPSRQ